MKRSLPPNYNFPLMERKPSSTVSALLFLLPLSSLFAAELTEREKAVLNRLDAIEARVDPANGLPQGTHDRAKGYHSNFERGTKVYSTRAAMDYGACLIASPNKEHQRRGNEILDRVFAMQDRNPESRTFGVWAWYANEPLEEMASVDFNWADFQGAVIAVVLRDYSDRLTGEVREKAKKALEYCCRAIIKRNVGPDYTNIAIMGATVTSAAGEILDRTDFLEYGRKRIQRNLEYYREVGGFNEYNSPNYAMVVVHELERMLYLVKDAECRAASTELLNETWKMIAMHYHVPTREWAGPHSRAYSDRLPAPSRNAILSRAGVLPKDGPTYSNILVDPTPAPETLRHYFVDVPTDPVQLEEFYAKGRRPEFETYGTTYMDAVLALGSASYHTFWEQTRGLIAYWKMPNAARESASAMLKMRFLHDGEDFTSVWGRHRQNGAKLVSAIGFLKNQGSMHPSFDRPSDGVFRAKSFRIVYLLNAKGATVKKLDGNRFELAAGPVRAVVHPAVDSHFLGTPVEWRAEQGDGSASVIGICYEGEEKAFPFREMGKSQIGVGLELLQGDAEPTKAPVQLVESDLESKQDGKFYGVLWPGVNDGKLLLAPLKPTNR